MLKITLNGDLIELKAACSVTQALHHWGYNPHDIAIAINQIFVSRNDYATTMLQNNDIVDIVAPMQGG